MVTAAKEEAEAILKDANDNYVPVELGELKRSGRTISRRRKNAKGQNMVTVSIIYGGPNVPYAAAVHEHPSRHTPPSWHGKKIKFTKPGTGHKYLHKAMNKAHSGMVNRLATRMKVL